MSDEMMVLMKRDEKKEKRSELESKFEGRYVASPVAVTAFFDRIMTIDVVYRGGTPRGLTNTFRWWSPQRLIR